MQETREFELTDDRHRRTLEFLTHSGWVYWDPKLHQERVIVGQKWALDGIYTVLDPRPRSEIYRILSRRDGRFTLSQLAEWVWREAGYSPTEQELFLSFMLRCGLCFRLRKGPEAWREEDVFVSFEHLPTANELRLQRTFDSRHRDSNRERRSFWVPGMHKHHWQSFLTSAGNYYGKDARYALDGFYLEISYAWDLPVREGETGIPPGYEVPVDAIETFLRDTEPIQSPAGRGCACAHLRRISTRRRPSSTAWAGPMGGPCRG